MGCSLVFSGKQRLFLDLLQFIQVIPNEMICEKWDVVKKGIRYCWTLLTVLGFHEHLE